MGSNISKSSRIHSQGALIQTDGALDLSVIGNGMFVLGPPQGINKPYYTRDGSINLDQKGNLLTSDGLPYLGKLQTENGLSKNLSAIMLTYPSTHGIFENKIQEAYAGMEFNFIDFNLHEDTNQITPYLFLGISYFRYQLLYLESQGSSNANYVDYGRDQTFGLPIFVGVKWNPNPLFVIGLEVGVRYTFTAVSYTHLTLPTKRIV